jgi:hypothetical protein
MALDITAYSVARTHDGRTVGVPGRQAINGCGARSVVDRPGTAAPIGLWVAHSLAGATVAPRACQCFQRSAARVSLGDDPVMPGMRGSSDGPASRTEVALTNRGRAALDAYTQTLRELLGGL